MKFFEKLVKEYDVLEVEISKKFEFSKLFLLITSSIDRVRRRSMAENKAWLICVTAMYIVAMFSVTKGVVYLLSLKNVEIELFLNKGSKSSKFKNCFSELFKFQMIALFFLIQNTFIFKNQFSNL